MKKIALVLLMLFTIYCRSYGQNDTWSWGVEKFTPEEQQEYNNRYNQIRSGQNTDNRSCHLEGSIETIVESMNSIGELLGYQNYSTSIGFDIDRCTFKIMEDRVGRYTCPLNASTGMYVFTDEYLNPEVILIYGPALDGTPNKTTLDWAYVASVFACLDFYSSEITEMFDQALASGYHEINGIALICGPNPYSDLSWIYMVSNE